MARIDLGDDDSGDALSEALRQLKQQQEGAKPAPGAGEDEAEAKRRFERRRESARQESREQVQDAVAAIREQQVTAEPAPRAVGLGRVRWAIIVVAIVALSAAAIVALRPEPLPAPAATPRDAVRGFWSSLIEEHYEGATVFYPGLVDRYGSRKQAALFLKQIVGSDPPVRIARVGEAESLPGSYDLRVSWEVNRRSGRPWTGEFIVRDSGDDQTGYVILTGP